jgi:hypothetical protein
MGRLVCILAAVSLLGSIGCGGDDKPEPLFPAKDPCSTTPIVPLQGEHQQVISFLEIGANEDGFDLDGDGEPDNKLSAVGTLARGAIEDSFEDFSIVIPIEFFDFPTVGADECVKFSMYLGQYSFDSDLDGDNTADNRGDCNDHDASINKDAVEVAGDYKDNDCDGLADETDEVVSSDAGEMVVVVPSDNVEDMDGDGVTIADGDCDDTNPMVKGPGTPEICGDGFDNDCDGNADFALDGAGNPVCTPYDDSATPDDVLIDPLSFEDGTMTPVIRFEAASVTANNQLFAGPALFSVGIPVTDDLNLDLRITGATIEADIVMLQAGIGLVNGRLGGVIDANTADKVTGLKVDEIGLTEEDTLLDAVFANLLGTLIGLPKVEFEEFGSCQTPDVDVDRDGLEAFCDSDPLDEVNNVDVCIDGDGTVYRDEVDGQGNVTKQCTEFTDKDGNLLFVDGISVEINFETVPVVMPSVLP